MRKINVNKSKNKLVAMIARKFSETEIEQNELYNLGLTKFYEYKASLLAKENLYVFWFGAFNKQ